MQMSQLASKAFQAAYAPEKPAKDRLAAVFDLVRFGYVDNAREVLAYMTEHHGGARTEWLEKICGRVEIYSRSKLKFRNGAESVSVEGVPEPVKVHPPTDVMIIRAPEADQLLISFGGANSAFWVPTPFFDLAKTSVIALRDDRRLWHLAGVKGLGLNFKESVAGLKELIKELGVERVAIAGCSSGGYSALRYALDLDVRGVLAISTPTRINANESELERYPALRNLARVRPEMMEDLRSLYQRHPNPPKVIIAWGDKNPLDDEQALRMKGLPNVTLEPVRGVAAHASWLQLGTDKQLESLLKRVLAF